MLVASGRDTVVKHRWNSHVAIPVESANVIDAFTAIRMTIASCRRCCLWFHTIDTCCVSAMTLRCFRSPSHDTIIDCDDLHDYTLARKR